MGFGLLLIGYITILGVLPESFIYLGWGIYIAVAGGLIMLAGFCKLQEYNIYFRVMKYITIVYILILLGFSPFLIVFKNEVLVQNFMFASKLIRIFFLFIFHYFLLSGILSLAKEVGNFLIERKTKRNIYFTFVFFFAFILEFFDVSAIAPILLLAGLAYFIIVILNIYSCYMRITYEGHDEEIEAKYNMKSRKNKKTR